MLSREKIKDADEIMRKLEEIAGDLKGLKDRMTFIEKWMDSKASVTKQTTPSPAMQECISTIKRMTKSRNDSFSPKEIAEKMNLAPSTVNAYLRILVDVGELVRHPHIKEVAPGRKVREWTYSLRTLDLEKG
jgi:response regulator of citrate/malate metabolism